MATLSKMHNKPRTISPADVGPEDVIVTWLLKRFKELPPESLKDIMLLIEAIFDPETPAEDRDDIYRTIREILFPQMVGDVCVGRAGSVEDAPEKLQRRTDYVGRTIKQEREAKGLTQAELAEKSGLLQPQISRLEAGAHSPSFKTLEKIAKALEVNACRFTGSQRRTAQVLRADQP